MTAFSAQKETCLCIVFSIFNPTVYSEYFNSSPKFEKCVLSIHIFQNVLFMILIIGWLCVGRAGCMCTMLVVCKMGLVVCGMGLVVCGVGLIVCGVGVVVCGLGLVVCEVGLVVCGLGLVVWGGVDCDWGVLSCV